MRNRLQVLLCGKVISRSGRVGALCVRIDEDDKVLLMPWVLYRGWSVKGAFGARLLIIMYVTSGQLGFIL